MSLRGASSYVALLFTSHLTVKRGSSDESKSKGERSDRCCLSAVLSSLVGVIILTLVAGFVSHQARYFFCCWSRIMCSYRLVFANIASKSSGKLSGKAYDCIFGGTMPSEPMSLQYVSHILVPPKHSSLVQVARSYFLDHTAGLN